MSNKGYESLKAGYRALAGLVGLLLGIGMFLAALLVLGVLVFILIG